LKVKVYADAQGAGRAAAGEVRKLIEKKRGAALGLATGHTMIPVYGELVRLCERGKLSLKNATTFNLDEYAGLGRGDHDSCYEYMLLRLVDQTDLDPRSFHLPDGKAPDLEAECKSYEKKIKDAGGIDLQFLGLGRNGHIGFNEPGSASDSRTRVVRLSERTREVNVGDFRHLKQTPDRGVTMGIATILEAGKIILVVTGWEKSAILYRMMTTPPAPEIPATFLHQHPETLLIADRQAMEDFFKNTGGESISFDFPAPTA
jgi:glucosamine-6-phosphate deaminase